MLAIVRHTVIIPTICSVYLLTTLVNCMEEICLSTMFMDWSIWQYPGRVCRLPLSYCRDQMAWFVDKLKEPESELDSSSVGCVNNGAPDCVKPEEGGTVDALTELGNANEDIANLGNEVEGQLATIVNNILSSRITDDKRKEKMDKFIIRPSNCDKLELMRANPENWDKVSVNATERDQLVLTSIRKCAFSRSTAFTLAVPEGGGCGGCNPP